MGVNERKRMRQIGLFFDYFAQKYPSIHKICKYAFANNPLSTNNWEKERGMREGKEREKKGKKGEKKD